MCIKKLIDWLNGPGPAEPMATVEGRILHFGKNIYPSGNSLNGCVNDSNNTMKNFIPLFPFIDGRTYLDSQAYCKNYIDRSVEAIKSLRPGATVCIIMDSCFSGTATRLMNNSDLRIKNRFWEPGLPPREKRKSKIFHRGAEMKWIALSGCGEQQTSADAYIGKQYEGAFTHYALATFRKGMTYREWHEAIRKYLPGNGFDQAPEIEGPEELLNRKIFEGQTLFICNSSHGSWTYDRNGDETDGRDEGIYFDRLLIDDEINEMLQQIP